MPSFEVFMKPSQNALNLIKQFEGCYLTAYQCPAGVWTIGYGHTYGVTQGMVINQQQADAYLMADTNRVAQQLDNLIKVSLNQNQFDALVSLVYNIGIGQLISSKLLQYINQSNFTAAAKEFDWIRVNGVILDGLVKRRAAEQKLFTTPEN